MQKNILQRKEVKITKICLKNIVQAKELKALIEWNISDPNEESMYIQPDASEQEHI